MVYSNLNIVWERGSALWDIVVFNLEMEDFPVPLSGLSIGAWHKQSSPNTAILGLQSPSPIVGPLSKH